MSTSTASLKEGVGAGPHAGIHQAREKRKDRHGHGRRKSSGSGSREPAVQSSNAQEKKSNKKGTMLV